MGYHRVDDHPRIPLLWPGSFDNINKLVEVIERDLNDRVDLFADAYADIYKHYDNAVKKLLDDKEELDKKIQDAFLERKEIIKGKLDLNLIKILTEY